LIRLLRPTEKIRPVGFVVTVIQEKLTVIVIYYSLQRVMAILHASGKDFIVTPLLSLSNFENVVREDEWLEQQR